MAAICTSVHSFSPPAVAATSRLSSSASTSPSSSVSRRQRVKTASYSMIVCMAPDEEKLTRRNPLDFPVVSIYCYLFVFWLLSRVSF
ncbi:hypothetical protein HanRHA438_Chr00c42g0857161 [Helianthus annuus]|nr:hypothetical protein HanRHA438_Chr00c42g0857161 [Helianthus annuus]